METSKLRPKQSVLVKREYLRNSKVRRGKSKYEKWLEFDRMNGTNHASLIKRGLTRSGKGK